MTKVLLISNDELSRQVLEQGLNQRDYDVLVVNQGDKGLTLAITASPDLILIDVNVPEVNGLQAIKFLKESRLTQRIPVIAIVDRTIAGQLLTQAGFDTYVRKPVSLRHILVKIEALLDMAFATQADPDEILLNPSTSGTNAVAPEATLQQRQWGQATVVYVDDNPAQSQAIFKIIQRTGYSCVRISDALQDLSQLIELMPQIIFIDLAPPMVNSYELCAQIRQISVFKETPIILVIYNDNIVDQLRARLAGGN